MQDESNKWAYQRAWWAKRRVELANVPCPKHGLAGRDSQAKCKLCMSERMKLAHRRLRQRVIAAYGGERPVCACCGEGEPDFLSIDHIDGGGGKHRREVGAGAKFYKWLEKNGFPQGFRILCYNCNHALGHYGACPHQAAGVR